MHSDVMVNPRHKKYHMQRLHHSNHAPTLHLPRALSEEDSDTVLFGPGGDVVAPHAPSSDTTPTVVEPGPQEPVNQGTAPKNQNQTTDGEPLLLLPPPVKIVSTVSIFRYESKPPLSVRTFCSVISGPSGFLVKKNFKYSVFYGYIQGGCYSIHDIPY